MTIAYDAVGPGNAVTSSSSVSWTHTPVASSTVVVFSLVASTTTGGASITATYGGTSMTHLTSQLDFTSAFGADYYLDVFYKTGVSSSPATVVVTAPSGSSLFGNSIGFTGVGSLGTLVTNSGTSASPAVSSVSSATGHVVVNGFVGGFGATAFTSYTQTSEYNHLGSDTPTPGGSWGEPMLLGYAAGASTVSFGATGNATAWGGAAVDLVPAASGVTVTPTAASLTATTSTPVVTVSTGVVDPTAPTLHATTGTPGVNQGGPGIIDAVGASTTLVPGTPAVTAGGSVVVQPPGAVIVTEPGTPGSATYNPFQPVLDDFAAGVDTCYLLMGDSTVTGYNDGLGVGGGWAVKMGWVLGQYYNYNVQLYTYVGVLKWQPASQYAYTAPGGSRPTIHILEAAAVGTGISWDTGVINDGWLSDAVAAGLTPKVCITGDGLNDFGEPPYPDDLPGGANYSTVLSNFDTYISTFQAALPGVPLILTDDNPTNNAANEYNLTHTNDGLANAGFQGIASHYGLTPYSASDLTYQPCIAGAIIQPINVSNVWFFDTRQLTIGLYVSEGAGALGDGLHPDGFGYQVIANGMCNVLTDGLVGPVLLLPWIGSPVLTATMGTPAVRIDTAIPPSGASLTATPGTPAVTRQYHDSANRSISYGGGVVFGGVPRHDVANAAVTVSRSVNGGKLVSSGANRSVSVTSTVAGSRASQSTANRAVSFATSVGGRKTILGGANRALTVTIFSDTNHHYSDAGDFDLVLHPSVGVAHNIRDGASRLVGIDSAVTVAASFRATAGWSGLSGTVVFTPQPASAGHVVRVQLDGSGDVEVNLPVIDGLYLVQFKNLVGPLGAESINPFAFECPEHAIDLNVIAGPAPEPHQWGIAE